MKNLEPKNENGSTFKHWRDWAFVRFHRKLDNARGQITTPDEAKREWDRFGGEGMARKYWNEGLDTEEMADALMTVRQSLIN